MIEYWQGQRFVFSQATGDRLRAHRGSLWANMVSFDMSRLKADLVLHLTGPAELSCEMTIDTRFQVITPWNRAFWELEMDTLESWLLTGDDRRWEWDDFRKECRRNDVLYSVTYGLWRGREK